MGVPSDGGQSCRGPENRLMVSKQTYMPQDYAATLSSKQLNDLISYLLQSAG